MRDIGSGKYFTEYCGYRIWGNEPFIESIDKWKIGLEKRRGLRYRLWNWRRVAWRSINGLTNR